MARRRDVSSNAEFSPVLTRTTRSSEKLEYPLPHRLASVSDMGRAVTVTAWAALDSAAADGAT